MTEPPPYSYGRPMFGFRLPWMIHAAPTARIRAPSEPQTAPPSEQLPLPRTTTATIPVQHRPSGAPVPPPSQSQLKPPAASPVNTQPQPRPPSPSPSPSQSRTAQMSPQSRVQPTAASPSLSQLRPELQSQITPPRPPQAAASQPPTPTRTPLQATPPTSQATTPVSQQPSSLKTNPKPPSTPSPTTSPPKNPQTPPRTESSSKPFQSPPSKVVSKPPSPSRTPTQHSIASSRVAASKPHSLPRLASQPPAKTPPPPTTSHGTSLQTTSTHVSPSPVKRKSPQSQAQASSQSPSPASRPESSSSKAAKYEPALSVPLVMKSQPLAEVSPVPASRQHSQIHKQATSEESNLPAVAAPTAQEKPDTQLPKSPRIPVDLKDHPKLETKTEEEEKPNTESSASEKKTIAADVEEPFATDSDEQHRGLPRAAASQAKPNKSSEQAHSDENGNTQPSKLSAYIPGKGMHTTKEPHRRPPVSRGEKTRLQEEIKDDISRFVRKLGSGHQMQPSEDVSVITLTGENKGASMRVGAETARKEGAVPISRGYKLNQDDTTDVTTDGESSSRGRKSSSDSKENAESLAYINSNVQSINNSIMFTSSISERNPGVEFVARSSNTDKRSQSKRTKLT